MQRPSIPGLLCNLYCKLYKSQALSNEYSTVTCVVCAMKVSWLWSQVSLCTYGIHPRSASRCQEILPACVVLAERVGKRLTKTFSTPPAGASSAASSAGEPLGAASTTSTAAQEGPTQWCYCKSMKANVVLRYYNTYCSTVFSHL